jgi:hypothetical protein
MEDLNLEISDNCSLLTLREPLEVKASKQLSVLVRQVL